jgi:hypothetical protein
MSTHYAGGCAHVHVTATAEPIDNHECHCNVCKGVTGQQTTHVAFFNHGDIQVDHPEKINRVPFNKDNPNGPLEICVCAECGAALMLDDKQGRIRVAVPNIMGYDDAKFPESHLSRVLGRDEGLPGPHRWPSRLRRIAAELRLAATLVGRGLRRLRKVNTTLTRICNPL